MSKPRSSKGASKPPAAKKTKLEASVKDEDSPSTSSDTVGGLEFLANIDLKRRKCSDNILDFKFNKRRCRLLSKSMELGDSGGGVLYWMSREQRVQGSIKLEFNSIHVITNSEFLIFLRQLGITLCTEIGFENETSSTHLFLPSSNISGSNHKTFWFHAERSSLLNMLQIYQQC